jgi:hypothetical protein
VEGANVAVPEQVPMRLDWSDIENHASFHVNQLIAQIGPPSSNGVPDGFYLAMGSITPPVILGDDDERIARIAELAGSVLKVDVHARIHVSREVLGDMITVLQRAADQYDDATPVAAERKPQERV